MAEQPGPGPIAIAGATGYLGTLLAEALRTDGHTVTAWPATRQRVWSTRWVAARDRADAVSDR